MMDELRKSSQAWVDGLITDEEYHREVILTLSAYPASNTEDWQRFANSIIDVE